VKLFRCGERHAINIAPGPHFKTSAACRPWESGRPDIFVPSGRPGSTSLVPPDEDWGLLPVAAAFNPDERPSRYSASLPCQGERGIAAVAHDRPGRPRRAGHARGLPTAAGVAAGRRLPKSGHRSVLLARLGRH
jgi:hypothetical protein